jgi:quercetin dioxygenase-like cupin family protein
VTTQHSVEPIVVRGGEGRTSQAGPLGLRVIEDGSHTSGTHAVLEFTITGQFSPPPHIHNQHEEVIYVLEGEMVLPVRGEVIRLGPGDSFITPIGLPHTFGNGTDGTLRFLLTVSPASHLAYFIDAADVIREAKGAPEPAAIMDVMRRYGLEPIAPA